MVVKYLDPYKDDPYGKIRGDKSDAYFKVVYDEAQIHKADDAYILAASVTQYEGVVRNYKPENSLTGGLCVIPIYGQEYEIRQKDKDNNWAGVKYQPSIYEKALYENIKADESLWIPGNQALKGELSFMPNGMVASLSDGLLKKMVIDNSQIEYTPLTGKLPEYTPPTDNFQRKGNGKSYGYSPEDRILFIKKQICSDLAASGFTVDNSLPLLINQMIVEHPMDGDCTQIYFDTLWACAR